MLQSHQHLNLVTDPWNLIKMWPNSYQQKSWQNKWQLHFTITSVQLYDGLDTLSNIYDLFSHCFYPFSSPSPPLCFILFLKLSEIFIVIYFSEPEANSVTCELCEYAMKYLESVLSDNATEVKY